MNIFEEYDTIIPNNNHINGVIKKLFPAQKQKEMNIHGIIIDSRWFIYLFLKYSQLESLAYDSFTLKQ